MKITTKCQLAAFVATIVFNVTAHAYSDDKIDEYCKKPKFTDLNFKTYSEPEKAEVPAGAQLSFRLPLYANPEKIKVTAKNQEIPINIVSNSSYHQVNFTLPDTFNGSIVRINVNAKTIQSTQATSRCEESAGWLVKVADK